MTMTTNAQASRYRESLPEIFTYSQPDNTLALLIADNGTEWSGIYHLAVRYYLSSDSGIFVEAMVLVIEITGVAEDEQNSTESSSAASGPSDIGHQNVQKSGD